MLSNRKRSNWHICSSCTRSSASLLTAFGLFGIALYAIRQRTKEIGIRKVNGATAEGDLVSIKSSVYRLGRDRFRNCRSYHVVFAELLAGEFRISGGHIHRNMPAVRRYRIDGYATDRKQA